MTLEDDTTIRRSDTVRFTQPPHGAGTRYEYPGEVPFLARVLYDPNVDGATTVEVVDSDSVTFPANVDEMERAFRDEAEACAYLMAAAIRSYGHAFSSGKVVSVYAPEGGFNFSNEGQAFDVTPGEIGPLDAYNDRVRDDAPEWAAVYANFIVNGLGDPDAEGFGYGLPTHKTGKAGATPRDESELPPLMLEAARLAGVPPYADSTAESAPSA